MKTQTISWALPALVLSSCLVPRTVDVAVSADVAGAPPPPRVVVVESPVGVVAEGGVYVVTDPSVHYDMFRFGGTWYLYTSGYWYRSRSHHGPFAVVEARRVPRPVLTLPSERWRYARRPPGHHADSGRRRGWDRDD